jgi:hypothetical protein
MGAIKEQKVCFPMYVWLRSNKFVFYHRIYVFVQLSPLAVINKQAHLEACRWLNRENISEGLYFENDNSMD